MSGDISVTKVCGHQLVEHKTFRAENYENHEMYWTFDSRAFFDYRHISDPEDYAH
jgi:hypothetical protein